MEVLAEALEAVPVEVLEEAILVAEADQWVPVVEDHLVITRITDFGLVRCSDGGGVLAVVAADVLRQWY